MRAARVGERRIINGTPAQWDGEDWVDLSEVQPSLDGTGGGPLGGSSADRTKEEPFLQRHLPTAGAMVGGLAGIPGGPLGMAAGSALGAMGGQGYRDAIAALRSEPITHSARESAAELATIGGVSGGLALLPPAAVWAARGAKALPGVAGAVRVAGEFVPGIKGWLLRRAASVLGRSPRMAAEAPNIPVGATNTMAVPPPQVTNFPAYPRVAPPAPAPPPVAAAPVAPAAPVASRVAPADPEKYRQVATQLAEMMGQAPSTVATQSAKEAAKAAGKARAVAARDAGRLTGTASKDLAKTQADEIRDLVTFQAGKLEPGQIASLVNERFKTGPSAARQMVDMILGSK